MFASARYRKNGTLHTLMEVINCKDYTAAYFYSRKID